MIGLGYKPNLMNSINNRMRIAEFCNIPETVLSDAISNPLGRDEEIGYKSVYFAQLPTIYKINGLELKRYVSADKSEIYYGLIDPTVTPTVLAGIVQLEKVDSFWQVRLTQITDPYKSQGYGSFIYDYAVMNNGLTLLSDTLQSEGSLGGSKGLWEKLYRQGRFTVCGYNMNTGNIIPLTDSSDIASKIYNQKEDVVWMATPKKIQETINEMLSRINNKNKHRTIQWYGDRIID
jgi:hypothetical protein